MKKKMYAVLLFISALCFSAELLQAQTPELNINIKIVGRDSLTIEDMKQINAYLVETPITDPNIDVIDKFYSNNKTVIDTTKGIRFTMECTTAANSQVKIVKIEFARKCKRSEHYCNPQTIVLIKEFNRPWYAQGKYENRDEYIATMLAQTVAYIDK